MTAHMDSIARSAEQRVNDQAGFPAQEQQPPDATGEMHPVPDHGEQSYADVGQPPAAEAGLGPAAGGTLR